MTYSVWANPQRQKSESRLQGDWRTDITGLSDSLQGYSNQDSVTLVKEQTSKVMKPSRKSRNKPT